MSCAESAPSITPEPLAQSPIMVAAGPVDPVSYDATRENERFARTDAQRVEAEAHRQQRIDSEEEDASQRNRIGRIGRGGFIGTVGARPGPIMPACGRG
jgi:hypothetical protein